LAAKIFYKNAKVGFHETIENKGRSEDRPCTSACTQCRSSVTRMKMLTHFDMRRIVTGWATFIIGLLLLLWLHTFRDSTAHSAILPLLLLLWIVLAVAVWDGCRAVTLRLRFVLLLLQTVVAFCASALFFQHLLRTSL